MRLADLLAGLSRFADLGFGLPAGTSLRSGVLAAWLAQAADLPPADAQSAFYAALLQHVGCVGYAHETARLFGDELQVNAAAGRTDDSLRDLFGTFLPGLTRGRPPVERARLALTALTRGGRWSTEFTATACELGQDTARQLGLPDAVQRSLLHVYDSWDGGGEIPAGARVARLTGVAALFDAIGGSDAAVGVVRQRAGGMLDPTLAAVFAEHATEWLSELDGVEPLPAVLAAEPEPQVVAPDLQRVAEVFADLTDLKSPYLLGHSRAVAALARAAAAELGLPRATQDDLELASLLHDVGRVAVPTSVWDKPGALTVDEWEQVRLHPYHSERILSGSAGLARLATLVGRHHERLDGSGYHRGCGPADLDQPARVLAAADAYRAMTEPRPHRERLAADVAAQRLTEDAKHGRLDTAAVDAVLAVAGHRVDRPPPPVPLSAREVEVLGLVARGCSNAQIAARLVISRRTAEHHVQHIYGKIGVAGRAAATLYAVRNRLLPEDG